MRLLITIFTLLFYFSSNASDHKQNGTILVTAATGALGSTICDVLASEGYNLLVSGRNNNKLTNLQKDLQKKYPNITVRTLIIDFSDTKTIENAASKITLSSIEGIVLIGPRPSLNKNDIPSKDEWTKVFAETFIAPLEVVRFFAPKIHNNGSIVVISGSSSKNFLPAYPNTNVVRLAWSGEIKNLMHLFATRKIRVNAISPGPILTQHHKNMITEKASLNNISYEEQLLKDTSSIPLKSYGETEDLGNLVVFLLSNKSSHINGSNILLDGGESTSY
ncbi:SDR family oxidoreductase [Candidatus Tisiphia endosymbiont of Piscicola geometra]|uniref:SDR family oxidoreductase n=1 Tax=Candidatus Tisiphia endosymbiont of Piscicola geometra TaxID=3066273 RepID=UPI00312CC22C